MKKQVLLLITLVLTLNIIKAQDVILTSQSQIDDFNSVEIEGSLIIEETIPGNITNLDGLSKLNSINGIFSRLTIKNNRDLNDITGLSNLIKVENTLSIEGNPSLTSLTGLSNLKESRSLVITNNQSLKNIDGLINLQTTNFYIGYNDSLENVDGLIGSSGSLDALELEYNTSLKNLDGFRNFVGHRNTEFVLRIQDNPSLVDACGIVEVLLQPKNPVFNVVTVSDNGINTSSIEDIINNCQTCQGIYNGNVTLATQTQIDTFKYCEVNGSLTIKESVVGDINNLDGLSNLTKISGSLSIKNNKKLTDLNALSDLNYIGGDFVLYDNQNLSSIGNFEALTIIGGKLSITRNPKLSDLAGFTNVQTIGGELYINRNASLKYLKGLSNLSSVGGSIYINNNNNLLSLDELKGIISVNANITITANFKLQNVDGFSNIASVGGDVTFKGNVATQQACGIVQLLNDQDAVQGAVSIVNNGANASTQQAIITHCMTSLTYVPDDNFEQALIDLGYDTAPLDDYVPTETIQKVTELYIFNKEISSLTGIEDFAALTHLFCYNNQLTTLNISSNINLEVLFCSLNQLTSLNISANTKLKKLFSNVNNLQTLDLSNNVMLEEVNIARNQLNYVNMKNGNNHLITSVFQASFNAPDLCIEVDNAADANNLDGFYSSWLKDNAASYSSDCGLVSRKNNGVSALNADVLLYPVPSNGYEINIKDAEKNTSYQVVSFSGHLVSEGVIQELDQQVTFNKVLSKGVYFIRLINGNNRTSKQFIVN